MKPPVNLENLHKITGSDKVIEQKLFHEFITNCDMYIEGLSKIVCLQKQSQESNDEWYSLTHALKGISLNLGADYLALLSQSAQEKSALDYHAKLAIFEDIKKEYKSVRAYLTDLIN